MNEHIWDIIILLVTNIATGGFIHFFTIKSTKRKEMATASQMENIATQESEKAQTHRISNTENVIKLYKEALNDIRDLNEREKTIMMDTIKDQDRKLEQMAQVIESNKKVINDLQSRLDTLNHELSVIKSNMYIECKLCPQSKLGCLNERFKTYYKNAEK